MIVWVSSTGTYYYYCLHGSMHDIDMQNVIRSNVRDGRLIMSGCLCLEQMAIYAADIVLFLICSIFK